ncbi:MAG: 1-(5-phosphoribosyl)-5-amino-4-imidazole-carboxylate carboxylase, partial [Nitrospinota bacterium]
MIDKTLLKILEDLHKHKIDPSEAYSKLESFPVELSYDAAIDTHRTVRQGFPEVIYAEGKTDLQSLAIIKSQLKHNRPLLVTRSQESLYKKVKKITNKATFNKIGRTIVIKQGKVKKIGKLLIIT